MAYGRSKSMRTTSNKPSGQRRTKAYSPGGGTGPSSCSSGKSNKLGNGKTNYKGRTPSAKRMQPSDATYPY